MYRFLQFIAALVVIFAAWPSSAQPVYQQTLLANNSGGSDDLGLSADARVAWLAPDNSVLLYDAATRATTQLSTTAVSNLQMNASGDVMWLAPGPNTQGDGEGDTDAYLYDHSTGVITNVTGNFNGNVSGARMNARGDIVWSTDQWSFAGPGVWLFERQSGTITNLANIDPAVAPAGQLAAIGDSGDVAWSAAFWDGVPGSGYTNDVVLYRAATRTVVRLTNDSNYEYDLAVNALGDVVWIGVTAASDEVFLYDSSTSSITQITNNSVYDSSPALNATGAVVWQEAGDIYLYDRTSATTRRLTVTGNSNEPSVNERGDIVWYDSFDVFAYDAESGAVTQLTNAAPGCAYYPNMNQYGDVVWHVWRSDTYSVEIHRAKKGTVAVQSAQYTAAQGEIVVTATSARGATAALQVEGFGPMTWDANNSLWQVTATIGPTAPARIIVFGPEGSDTALVQYQ